MRTGSIGTLFKCSLLRGCHLPHRSAAWEQEICSPQLNHRWATPKQEHLLHDKHSTCTFLCGLAWELLLQANVHFLLAQKPPSSVRWKTAGKHPFYNYTPTTLHDHSRLPIRLIFQANPFFNTAIQRCSPSPSIISLCFVWPSTSPNSLFLH